LRRLALLLILIVPASGGCSRGLGPRTLAVDRTAYIEALGDSWREQLLFNIVKIRYHDALTFLDVSGITQTYLWNATGSVGYNAGWGAGTKTNTTSVAVGGGLSTSEQRVLPLVPSNTLTAGISSMYQTYPTITYSPIAGEVIKTTIFTPLEPVELFRALIAGWKVNFIIPYCFLSINNVQGIIPNPQKMNELVARWTELDDHDAIIYDFGPPPEPKDEGAKRKPDNKEEKTKGSKSKPTQLDKLTDNLVEFTSNLVKKQKEEPPKKEDVAYITLDKEKDPKGVENFQDLLGLNKSMTKYQVVSVTVPPTQKENLDKICIHSRSVFQILTLLAYFVEVPTSQEKWVWPGKEPIQLPDIPHFHILSTSGLMRPNEFVAIKYKGQWFYIPEWDTDTKRVFSGLMAIFSMMKTAPAEKPILTIPVR